MLHFNTIWLGHSKYEMPRENLLRDILYLKCLASFVEGRVRRLFTLSLTSPLSLFILLLNPFSLLSSHPALFFLLHFLPFSPLFFPPFTFVATEVFIKPLKCFRHIKKSTVNHIADIIHH